MRFRLARRTAEALDAAGVAYAVIGAAAMPLHGYSRATADLDLLVFDRRALGVATWDGLVRTGTPVQIRLADDDDDPVVGVVRVGRPGRRQCDVVMPRGAWHRGVIERAMREGPRLVVDGLPLPAATLGDLIALKLDVGGPLDLRDVHELLNVEGVDGAALRAQVDARLTALGPRAHEAWRALLKERG